MIRLLSVDPSFLGEFVMAFSIVADQGRVVLVVIQGCLTQPDVAPPIDPFRALLGPEAYQRKVLLDLRDSNYLDSMCIGWLLSSQKRFRENGGQLVLHSLQPMAANVFSLLRLDKVFHIAEDQQKALELTRDEEV